MFWWHFQLAEFSRNFAERRKFRQYFTSSLKNVPAPKKFTVVDKLNIYYAVQYPKFAKILKL